jgi:hypothetical protein
MDKFLLLSILIATIALPMRLAKGKTARGGLRRVVVGMTLYIFCWIFFCAYLFTLMGGGQ